MFDFGRIIQIEWLINPWLICFGDVSESIKTAE